MRKSIIFTCALIINFLAFSQDYKLTFSGSGQSNDIEQVTAINLNRNTSVTLSGNDVLHLVGQLTYYQLINSDNTIKIFPNPSSGVIKTQFHLSTDESVRIDISDINGRNLFLATKKCNSGWNELEISGLKSGINIIRLSSSQCFASGKIISNSNNLGAINIKHSRINSEIPALKSGSERFEREVQMLYKDGERLLLRGKSGNYARIVPHIATKNEVIDFDFIPCSDADNNHYAVVTIGNQTWMANNLNSSKYANGENIAHLPGNDDWKSTNNGAWSYYNNDEKFAQNYGKLYNWYSVIDPRNVCPTGWRAPSNVDWDILRTFLDPNTNMNNNVAGGKMKDIGTVLANTGLWNHPNTGATNETGFNGVPAGSRVGTSGDFDYIGQFAIWWSTTPGNESNSWCHGLHYQFTRLSLQYNGNKNGLSVRCLLNTE